MFLGYVEGEIQIAQRIVLRRKTKIVMLFFFIFNQRISLTESFSSFNTNDLHRSPIDVIFYSYMSIYFS